MLFICAFAGGSYISSACISTMEDGLGLIRSKQSRASSSETLSGVFGSTGNSGSGDGIVSSNACLYHSTM